MDLIISTVIYIDGLWVSVYLVLRVYRCCGHYGYYENRGIGVKQNYGYWELNKKTDN